MVALAITLIIAFTPGLFWLWIIYTRDKYQPEPWGLVIRTFLLGIGIAIPVAIVEVLLYPDPSGSGPTNLEAAVYLAFVVAGITEEMGKFLVVRVTIYGSRCFNEPIDGIVYASAVALGFASIENAFYVFQFGATVMLIRGVISTISHAVFSSLWGYPLAVQKVNRKGLSFGLAVGLLAAITVHGLFNFMLFAGDIVNPFYLLGFLAVFIAGIVIFVLLIRHARRLSQPQ